MSHDFERRAWVEYVISISKLLFGRFCCQHLPAACQVEIQASPAEPKDVNMPAALDGCEVSWPLGWPMWDWSCCKLPREALHFIGKLPREALQFLAICYFLDVARFWEKGVSLSISQYIFPLPYICIPLYTFMINVNFITFVKSARISLADSAVNIGLRHLRKRAKLHLRSHRMWTYQQTLKVVRFLDLWVGPCGTGHVVRFTKRGIAWHFIAMFFFDVARFWEKGLSRVCLFNFQTFFG